jgi:Tfp pilus assembly protein PilN
MIRTNLYVGKKPFNIADVGGFDLSSINIKMLVIVILVSYVPEFLIYDGFKNDLITKTKQNKKLNLQQKDLVKQTRELKNIELQIEALTEQEARLASKLKVVKQIIKIRNNPMNILLYIAKNIPGEIWLTKIEMKDKQMIIDGQSTSYKSIGVFIENLRNSVFFNKSIRLSKSQSGLNKSFDKRTEQFQITGPIISYE